MALTVVILTYNEARHIGRAIESIRGIASSCVVVDSGSVDGTVDIALAYGASVLQHPFIYQAQQFNWALAQLPEDTDWIMRLDADEIVTAALANEIGARLTSLGPDIEGVYLSRRIAFLGRPIRHGGVFPSRVLRLFRHGKGRCENRWMDEHIVVQGATADFDAEILDDNLNSMTWWTAKHNLYANREVVDILNKEYGFLPLESSARLKGWQPPAVKRRLKEQVYGRLPGGVRAFLYFFYRYILRLGFLDGYEGAAFHVLQGLWYRYLVDVKLHEVRRHMQQEGDEPLQAIRTILGLDVQAAEPLLPSSGFK